MSQSGNKSAFVQIMNLPLHAEMRKYPLSVKPLKAKSTTGRVWPLHVNGVCRVAAIVQVV